MPLYEYRCPKCEELFEIFRSLSDRDAPASCPACGFESARREFARVQAVVRATSGGGCGRAGSGFS